MEIHHNTIYNMDCLEGMANIPDESIDAIICDLPYGVTRNKWDSVIPFDKLWDHYLRVIKPNGPIILFAQGMFTAKLMTSQPNIWRYNLVWDKMATTGFLNANRMPLRRHEDICVFYKALPDYFPQMVEGKKHDRNHGIDRKGNDCRNNCYDSYKNIGLEQSTAYYPTSILSFKRDSLFNNNLHPTQKPVMLIEWLIMSYTQRGG